MCTEWRKNIEMDLREKEIRAPSGFIPLRVGGQSRKTEAGDLLIA
jgi:hypothetical protein